MPIITKLPMILALIHAPLAFSAQASPLGKSNESSGDKVNRGIEAVKQGTKEAAEGLSNAATEASKEASAKGRKVGRAIKSAACPVVGDRKTKMYYAKDSKSYEGILDGQKFFEDDDRACFMSEESARAEGYSRDAN